MPYDGFKWMEPTLDRFEEMTEMSSSDVGRMFANWLVIIYHPD